MPLWDEKKSSDALTLITWLIAKRNPDGSWPVDGQTEIVTRELASSSTPRLPAGMVMKVLNELATRNDQITTERFETVWRSFSHHPAQPSA